MLIQYEAIGSEFLDEPINVVPLWSPKTIEGEISIEKYLEKNVREAGLEPAWVAPLAPQTSVSTSFTTRAWIHKFSKEQTALKNSSNYFGFDSLGLFFFTTGSASAFLLSTLLSGLFSAALLSA